MQCTGSVLFRTEDTFNLAVYQKYSILTLLYTLILKDSDMISSEFVSIFYIFMFLTTNIHSIEFYIS